MEALIGNMKFFFSLVAALLFIFAIPVEAGSRIWEPSRASNLISPRWVHFHHQRRSTRIWPNKHIPICFDDLDAENALALHINAAMELWYAAGLPAEYKVERAHHVKCARERENVLWVYNGKSFATSVGLMKRQESRPGSIAILTVSDEYLDDPAANIAHELGHAWGLYHEQQNPVFWAANNLDSMFRFRCENLHDFDEKAEGLQMYEIWGHDGICRNLHSAIAAQFSAVNYLPMSDAVQKFGWYVTEDDVDWNSIMILPTWIGGNDKGDPMTREDGTPIGANLVPSAEDVEGIRHLYEDRLSFPEEVLLNDPRSDQYALFQQYAPGCIH